MGTQSQELESQQADRFNATTVGVWIYIALTFIVLIATSSLLALVLCGPAMLAIVWCLERSDVFGDGEGIRQQLWAQLLVTTLMVVLSTCFVLAWVF